jgi:hypothetical protein
MHIHHRQCRDFHPEKLCHVLANQPVEAAALKGLTLIAAATVQQSLRSRIHMPDDRQAPARPSVMAISLRSLHPQPPRLNFAVQRLE